MTFEAQRRCPRCGVEWTNQVDNPDILGMRSAICRPCRFTAERELAVARTFRAMILEPQGEWVDWALCAEVGGEIFFPEHGESVRPAKAICADCPVRVECLDWAMRTHQVHGVWGGLSERERRRLKGAA